MLDNSLLYEKSLKRKNNSEIDYYLKAENIKYSLNELINLSKKSIK